MVKQQERPFSVALASIISVLTGLVSLGIAFVFFSNLSSGSLITDLLPLGMGIYGLAAIFAGVELYQMKRRGWLNTIFVFGIAVLMEIVIMIRTGTPNLIRLILTIILLAYIYMLEDEFEEK